MRTSRITGWLMIGWTTLCLGDIGLFAQQNIVPPPAAPALCTQAIQCPDPYSFSNAVGINLTPSGGVCRFDPRVIERLELSTQENVSWNFCNECAQDMVIQLDTSSSGPFKSFRHFWPLPAADNLVTVNVGCYNYGSATGIDAQHSGTWKYSLRAKPAGSISFPDEIDPELVIDDFLVPPNFQTPMWAALAAIVGLILGYWLARRARSAF